MGRINDRIGVGSCIALALGLSLGALGCSDGGEGSAGSTPDEATASVQVELTTVPPAAQCVRLTTTPSSGAATVRTFTVTAGSASVLSLGKLAPGSYTLAGDAFNVACTSIGTSVADWIADSVPLSLRTGVTASATLTFRKNNPVSVAANFVNNVLGIALGAFGSVVATDGGILQAGATSGTKVFTRANFAAFDSTTVPGNAVVSVTATVSGGCAARADGTLWCWGSNNAGELGPGITVGTTSATPVQVAGIAGATQVVSSNYHACALAAGAVYCWGYNGYGELGNGTTVSSSTPSLVWTGAKQLAAGSYTTYAVGSDGLLYGWGSNGSGQIGDGSTTNHLSPSYTGEGPAKIVTAGALHACSQRIDGTVRCWGYNGYGELGNGTTASSTTPVLVPGLTVQQLSATGYDTCAINLAGQTLCWGINSNGEVGDGSGTNRLSPTSVALGGVTLTTLSSAGASEAMCGIASTLDLYCWGFNSAGLLGEGTTNDQFLPIRAQLQ